MFAEGDDEDHNDDGDDDDEEKHGHSRQKVLLIAIYGILAISAVVALIVHLLYRSAWRPFGPRGYETL